MENHNIIFHSFKPCLPACFHSLSRTIQVGLLAAWRCPGWVPLCWSDQPGSHMLSGLYHPAAIHDPWGPTGCFHCQGVRRDPEHRFKRLGIRALWILILCLYLCCSMLRISNTRPHCWSCRRCLLISWCVYSTDWPTGHWNWLVSRMTLWTNIST